MTPSSGDAERGARRQHVERTRQRYASGVFERENTLELYDSFLSRIDPSFSAEALVRAALRRRRPCRLLDLGCGDAGALSELRTRLGTDLVALGVDLVPPPEERLDSFIEGDAASVDLPADCDLILSFRALHEIALPGATIRRCREALAPGGRAILSIRAMETRGGPLSYAGAMERGAVAELEAMVASGRCGPFPVHALGRYQEAEGMLQEPGDEAPRRARVRFLAGVDLLMEAPG